MQEDQERKEYDVPLLFSTAAYTEYLNLRTDRPVPRRNRGFSACRTVEVIMALW